MASLSVAKSEPPAVTVFLGAGASQFAGYLTFRTFDRLLLSPHVRAREGLPALDSDTERFLEEVRQALVNIQRPTTHDNYLWLLNNYKDFCTKFNTHAGVQRRFEMIYAQVPPFSDAIRGVIHDITHTTLHHYRTKRRLDSSALQVRDFYLHLARINCPSSPHLPIFTTNYDLLPEDLLLPPREDSDTIPLLTGIPNSVQEGSAWSSRLLSPLEGGICLHRLHGCVAWFYHGHPDPNVYFHRDEPYTDWNRNLCVMFPGREIFPGRNPHGFGFRSLYRSLLSCAIVIFIGFSFRDDDVVHTLLAANAARPWPLRLVVVDPHLTQDDFFKALEDSTTRLTLPFRTPVHDEVRYAAVTFGSPGSCAHILDFVQEELTIAKASQRY